MKRILARLAALLAPARGDRDTQDELRFHLDMETEKLVRSGLSPAAARRRARLALGSTEAAREEAKDARGGRWLEDTVRDLRHAVRQLRRTPVFTAVAVVTLALGIGANTAIFSVVDGVLLRRLPFEDPDRLVVVWETDRNTGTHREPVAWPDYLDFRERASTLGGGELVQGIDVIVSAPGAEPLRAAGARVTHGYFNLVGITPLLGRGFAPEEDVAGGPRVALLGEAFWRARYGADPGVLGRTVLVNEEAHTIVGVMPVGADFALDQIHDLAAYHVPYTSSGDIAVWAPLQASAELYSRDTHPFFLVARLAPEATLAAARTEIAAIAADLEAAYRSNTARGAFVEPLTAVAFGRVRPVLALMLGAVILVLLVTCVNVANLLLARGTARTREVAVRVALGAGRGRLARQFLAEALLLSLLGGALAVGLAFGGLGLLLGLAPAEVPRLDQVALDLRVLGLTLGVSLAAGLAFGLVPTLQARRVDPMQSIRPDGGGGRGRRTREALVVLQLALALMLVAGAGLLIRSFRSILAVDPGFRAAGVLKAEFQLPATRYPRDFRRWPAWTEVHRFQASLLERVTAIPGVQHAALAGAHPLDAGFTNSFVVVGREAEARDWPEISVRTVTPGYFATLDVPVRLGRSFTEGDAAPAPPVALINQTAADRFFPGADPLGHEIRFWGIPRRIVGVVGDERIHGLTSAVPPAVYMPLAQAPSFAGTAVLLVRTAGDPTLAAPAVRAAVTALDPALAVYGVEHLSETLLGSIGDQRFAMLLLVAFGGVTLVLALVGIHGVVSYATAQRTHELGIRAALGAGRRRIASLVLSSGVRLAAAGTLAGLAGALLGSRLLAGFLYGVGRADPATFLGVAALMLGGALLAAWIPARRAARIPPIEALRVE